MFANDVKISLVNLTTTAPHIHAGLQCMFVLRGSIFVELEGRKIKLSSEDLLVVDSNQLHSVIAEDSNVVLILEVEKEYIRKECGDTANADIKCHCIGHSDESSNYYALKRTVTQMLYTMIKKEDGFQLDFKVGLLRFLHILYTGFRVENSRKEERRNPEAPQDISMALTYINENLYYPMKLEDVAENMYMSPQYFSKFFKRKMGIGFLDYLTSLRLEKAVKNLVYTEESIIKIALDHGFSNAKSFTAAFKKKYNETPGSFRKQYQNRIEKDVNETEEVEINLDVDIDLKEFMRYVKRYDISFEQTSLNKKSHSFALQDKCVREIQMQENLLNIGRVETAGYTDLYNQLETLRDNLGFRYVYFQLEDYFVQDNVHYSLILYNQFFRIINRIKKLNMIPFIKIELSKKYERWGREETEEDLVRKINNFLYCVEAVYPKEFLKEWKIEVCIPSEWDSSYDFFTYETICREVKKRPLGIKVGYYGMNKIDEKQKERFLAFLEKAKKSGQSPDFITFGAFAMEKQKGYMSNQFFYEGLQGYYKEIIHEIEKGCTKVLGTIPDLYMTEWNTMMGDLKNESILYFRSAIILEALLEVNPYIKGAAYWSDSSVSGMYSGELPMTTLALHMIDGVRRPVYSVLEVIHRMGENIIHEGENILVSCDKENQYNILIWNPKYLNPSYSVDDATVESLTENVNIKINNITPGTYQVKKVTCNRDHSGAVTQIADAGYPDFTDMEVFDYIQYNIAHRLNVYEERISHKQYVLNTNLSYNSVVMYIITKK